jgi:hypothetical protein
MIVQLASDLHLEMMPDKGLDFLKRWVPAKRDMSAHTLVLAGDITSAHLLEWTLGMIAPHYRHVVYVPGNHEFYGTNPDDGWIAIWAAGEKFDNVHVLDNEAVTLDGVRFYGGTGWFPYCASADQFRSRMNDFYQIKDLEPWCYGECWDFDVKLHGEKPDVVVSHHLPDFQCVAPKYRMSALNAFFVSNFDVKGSGAKLWLHGHTHEQTDLMIGQTRVIANPRGYHFERESVDNFAKGMVIDV